MAKKIQRRAIDNISVRDAVDEYLTSIKRLKSKTQDEYKSKLGYFVDYCTEHKIYLSDISARVIDDFLEHMKRTHKPCKAGRDEISSSTLASEVRIIKIFLNWCLEDEEYCERVKPAVIRRIKNVKITQEIIETFSADQIEALFKACDKEESEHLQMRDRAIVAVLLDTGIRASELIHLRLCDVSLSAKDSYIQVFGKGDKWGEVGLGSQSRKYLQKYIRMYRDPTIEYQVKKKEIDDKKRNQAVVFVGRSGSSLTVSGLQQIIERLGDWAHVKNVRCSPHTFRHTFARMFVENGGDVYKLSKLLRHSSIKTTEEYLKSLEQSEARKGTKSVLDNLS